MSIFIARWPNGDFTIVCGENRLAIDEVLDEEGDPGSVQMTRLNHAVAVRFKMRDDTSADPQDMFECFEFDGFDEQSLGDFWTAYPVLYEAYDDTAEGGITVEKVKAAMETERFSINVTPEISDDPQLAALQKMTGISKRMAENYKKIADEIEEDDQK